MTDSDSLVFGRYRVLRRLAVGGMGELFLAKQQGIDVNGFERLIVLKSLLPNLTEDRVFVEQFLDEARVSACLNHPNIVAVYEVGEWQGHFLIALEYIDGTDLARVLQTFHSDRIELPSLVAAKLVRDTAAALHHAHVATGVDGRPLGIIHRDVSPSNLMVRRDGVVKVVDFGVAKAANRMSKTSTGMLKGKFSYMSPEQIEMADLDHRSDQFGLGVVFWELLTQERLFQGLSEFMTFDRILNQSIPKPSTVKPDVPPELESIAMRMLARYRDDRFTDCQAVVSALDAYLIESGQAPTERELATIVEPLLIESPPPSIGNGAPDSEMVAYFHRDEAPPPTSSRRKRFMAGLGLAGALLLVALLVLFRGWGPEPKAPPEPPPLATYTVSTDPEGASILWDNQAMGDAPVVIDGIPPGEHALKVELDGFSTVVRDVDVRATDDKELLITLTPVAQAPPVAAKPRRAPGKAVQAETAAPREGQVSIQTTPWTEVSIDGKAYGFTPLYKVALAPGPRTVTLVNTQKGISVTKTITVTAGKSKKFDWKLER
ncbi:MAG: serine/threonine-protein kinase [Myxococcota bacterium]